METIEIRAVEMTRRIRARYSDELHGATPAERIRFYRQKAKNLETELGLQPQPANEVAPAV